MSKYKFFAYCPDRGFDVFETLDEALDAAEERIHDYHDDDGWSEEVTSVRVGEITHSATMCDQIFPEGEIDEDGLDKAGNSWEYDEDYKCNYKMLPVERSPSPDVAALVEALERCMTSMLDAGFNTRSAVMVQAWEALAAHRKQGG